MSKWILKNNGKEIKGEKIIQVVCPACGKCLGVYQNPVTTLSSHFRDSCIQRLNWIKHILPRIPVYVFTVLGLWNTNTLTFKELSMILSLRPYVVKTKILLPTTFVYWIKHVWKRLVQWDKQHHSSIPWLSSGSVHSHIGALTILFPQLYGQLNKFQPPKKQIQKTVNTLHTKRDMWSYKDRQYRRYLEDKYLLWLNTQQTEIRLWSCTEMDQPCDKWVVKRYSNRLEYIHLNMFKSNESDEDNDDDQVEKKDYYYFLPGTNINLSIYDCLVLECMFLVPISDNQLRSMVLSFRTAWNSYLVMHGFKAEKKEHTILVSACKQYVLLKSDNHNLIRWSISMQYDFMGWWMTLDHTLMSFFTEKRQSTRLAVPYMVPHNNGPCPYCYRFVKNPSHICRTSVPRELECILADSIVFPRLDSNPPQTILLSDMTNSTSRHIRSWLQALYRGNKSLMALKHKITLPSSTDQLFQMLQLLPQLCHQHSRSETHCLQMIVPTSDSENPILHTHEWELVAFHDYHSHCDSIHSRSFHSRSKRNFKSHSFYKIYCASHHGNFIADVNHLYGYIDLYNLLDLDTPHFSTTIASIWNPCVRLVHSIQQSLS